MTTKGEEEAEEMMEEEELEEEDDEQIADEDGFNGDEEEAGGISVVTALKWIPRSYLLEKPIAFEMSKEELEAMKEQQDGNQLEGNGEGNEEDDDDNLPLSQLQDMQLNEDRLQRLDENDDSDLGSDVEDHCYKPQDKILVTATVEDDQASLEIHTYDTETGSFFVHHDIALPSYPLCIEWIGVRGKELNWTETESQSFLAVGAFVPHIEIWSLDVLDALEPNAKLEGHTDAVMCLAWNTVHPHLLASGSGDCSVKLWDLQTSQCGKSFSNIHKDKVQSATWNPAEPTVLLTGSFDRNVCVFDARDPSKVAKYAVAETDVECVVWDCHNPAIFGVSTEGGVVSFVDVRLGPSGLPLLSFQAHEKACSTLCGNARVPGLYATCSADKTVKLWDLQQDLTASSTSSTVSANGKKKKSKKPTAPIQEKTPVATRKMKVGKLFACQFSANVDEEDTTETSDPFLIATGGSKGSVALWHAGSVEDDEDEERIRSAFEKRVLPTPKVWNTRS